MNYNNLVCSFQQCCFLYPLRKGLLIWGYLNLVRYCLQDGIATGFTAENIRLHHVLEDEKHQDLFSVYLIFVATLTLALANLIFNIIFVTGLHKRDERLLRSHYYYWIVTTGLYIVLFVGVNTLALIFGSVYDWMMLYMDPVSYEIIVERPLLAIVDAIAQIYFLILLRNQIRILDKGDQLAFLDPFDSGIPGSRPQSMAETVRNAIETQPTLNTHRF